MSERIGFFERISDSFNPIVVRELRQAVHGKFVAAVLLLLLTIQMAAIAIFTVTRSDISSNFEAGREVFIVLDGILLAVSLLFVPAYTAIRLASERSDANVDLLFITTISPAKIITGKLLASLAITVLIFSACMPFMIFTYWLRGVDIPTIFVLLGMSFFVVATMIQLGTFAACLPAGRVLKVLVGLLALSALPQTFVFTLTGSYWMLNSGIGSQLYMWSFWGPALMFLSITISVIGLLFFLSVALITPVSANRALPVRLYLTATWFITGVIAAIVGQVEKTNDPITVWGILSAIAISISFFVAISERESLGRRVTRKIPRSLAIRIPAFLVFSGAASGLTWGAVMAVATVVAVMLVWRRPVSAFMFDETLVWIAGLTLYFFAYNLTALFLRRKFLSRWLSPKYTWSLSIVLLVVGCVLPFLFGYFLFFTSWQTNNDIGLWLIGNPFALGTNKYQETYLVIAAIWALLFALLNAGWFFEQVNEFEPDESPNTSLAWSKTITNT